MRKLQADRFEIGFPAGWTDNSTISLLGPNRPTFAPNVQVNTEPVPQGDTVQHYFAEQRAELHSLPSFRLVEAGDRLLGGQRAEYHTYVWRHPQLAVDVRQMQVATALGGTIFTVTCSCMDSDWPTFEPAFDMILAGFRFK